MCQIPLDFGVFTIFGGIPYENWWSTNSRKNNSFVFGNKFTFIIWISVAIRIVIFIRFAIMRAANSLHHMSLFANKKYTSWTVTVQISICRMMLFYLELANIIRMALAELFQAVGSLFNSFVAIRCHAFTIERVHAAHVRFV